MNKVIHGDCLVEMKKMPDRCVNCIITSPPYNMRTRIRNGEYTTRESTEHFSKKYAHFDDALPIEDYYRFHTNCLTEMLRISHIVFYNVSIVTGSKEALFKIIGDFNTHIKDIIVWDKGHGQPAMHASVLNRACELILVLENPPLAGRAFATSYFKRGEMDDIWRIKRPKAIKGHGACFPMALVSKILTGWTKAGDVVLDPFAGSGTAAIACKATNRNFILIEKEKEYIDIINKRIADYDLCNELFRKED